jgi:hypothetical protein
MTKEDIYFMAKQVGIDSVQQHDSDTSSIELLERFANLVAQHEREACANLCEQHGYEHYCGNVTDKLAETIRARGQA